MDQMVETFKALSDMNRLQILEMLSCGEMCACDIVDGLNLSQPTISHHMKILQGAGIITSEKRGKWMFYSINQEKAGEILSSIKHLMSDKEDCICKSIEKKNCC